MRKSKSSSVVITDSVCLTCRAANVPALVLLCKLTSAHVNANAFLGPWRKRMRRRKVCPRKSPQCLGSSTLLAPYVCALMWNAGKTNNFIKTLSDTKKPLFCTTLLSFASSNTQCNIPEVFDKCNPPLFSYLCCFLSVSALFSCHKHDVTALRRCAHI